jgi:aromatic ring hydroxylase
MKADPANRDTMSYEEEGARHSIYFLKPRNRDDLQRRMLGHRRIAELTFGMFGRSPDHVASFVTGMAMKPDAPPAPHAHADNLRAITATCATTTSTWSMPRRRRPRAILSSITSRTSRCRRRESYGKRRRVVVPA